MNKSETIRFSDKQHIEKLIDFLSIEEVGSMYNLTSEGLKTSLLLLNIDYKSLKPNRVQRSITRSERVNIDIEKIN